MSKKLVQFGAGNIGRSFIGQVFARGGYEVVFIDIDEKIIEALNREREYRVVIKKNKEADEILRISHVRGVNGKDTAAVTEEISEASCVATSVGKGALPHIMPVLAEGLKLRERTLPNTPLDIIIAENVRGGAEVFRKALGPLLGRSYPLERLVGLVETSIGKMVPIMKREDTQKDPLWIFAEAYNTLIVNRGGFLGGIPEIPGIKPVDNITAYVDRKLFIHNLGHAATAYLGYMSNPGFTYIWEPLERRDIFTSVRTCMLQSARALNAEYPADLSLSSLTEHIDDLLERFRNRALGDTIFRVGRDLPRKLDKNDRLTGAMLLAEKHGLPYESIAEAAVAGILFRGRDEGGNLYPADSEFAEKDYPRGIDHILSKVFHLSDRDDRERGVSSQIKKTWKSIGAK